MRLLLDTNILIPLEDSKIPLRASLANFVRIANENGHQLVYHPASEDDIRRDPEPARRAETLSRLRQYARLERIDCPWNDGVTSPNDLADNEILYALDCEAAHALVTEDREIHDNARQKGLGSRVYTIQTAEDWLKRLHQRISVQLPNIEELSLYQLTPKLTDPFFDSLRNSYPGFDDWFRKNAPENCRAWVSWESPNVLGAICVFKVQRDEVITEDGKQLTGQALKLSTFKVGETVRGRKIGELFLKAAFRHATANNLQNIFIHGDAVQHHFLFELLEDFGFIQVGTHLGSGGRDLVYVKEHPATPPAIPPDSPMGAFEYLRRYFPHFRNDASISKFIVPIKPQYHKILFPDYVSQDARQLGLFPVQVENTAGNAIKLAYLSTSPTKRIPQGAIVFLYRSSDEQAITSIGVVEEYKTLSDASEIASMVSRRTVYTMDEITQMATRPTRVMLFRLVSRAVSSFMQY